MNEQHYKFVLDAAAIANVVATIVGLLPAIAAAFTIVWTGLQIYSWVKARKSKRPQKPE